MSSRTGTQNKPNWKFYLLWGLKQVKKQKLQCFLEFLRGRLQNRENLTKYAPKAL